MTGARGAVTGVRGSEKIGEGKVLERQQGGGARVGGGCSWCSSANAVATTGTKEGLSRHNMIHQIVACIGGEQLQLLLLAAAAAARAGAAGCRCCSGWCCWLPLCACAASVAACAHLLDRCLPPRAGCPAGCSGWRGWLLGLARLAARAGVAGCRCCCSGWCGWLPLLAARAGAAGCRCWLLGLVAAAAECRCCCCWLPLLLLGLVAAASRLPPLVFPDRCRSCAATNFLATNFLATNFLATNFHHDGIDLRLDLLINQQGQSIRAIFFETIVRKSEKLDATNGESKPARGASTRRGPPPRRGARAKPQRLFNLSTEVSMMQQTARTAHEHTMRTSRRKIFKSAHSPPHVDKLPPPV
jgi:hypothetical protein